MQLIGMIHLLPLPGAPRFGGSIQEILDRALHDAEILVHAGFDGMLIENYGDTPFHKSDVPPHTISGMTMIAGEIRRAWKGTLGIQVLRNDANAALAIVSAIRGDFIRVNVLNGAMLTDQGIIESDAAEVLRYRALIAPQAKIWADVQVKHAHPLVEIPLEDDVRDLVHRSLADAIIVSGKGTGFETSIEDVRRTRSATTAPIIIGSGVSANNIRTYLGIADGVIVGTAIKKDRITTNPVDRDAASTLVGLVHK